MSLLFTVGTLTTLDRAEFTERGAVLDRAEAGAATLEQTLLRVFGAVDALQSLAQTRLRLLDAGNTMAALTIEQELREAANQSRLGIMDVSILGPDGGLQWQSATGGNAGLGTIPPMPLSQQGGAPGALSISPPYHDPATHRWVMRASRALLGERGDIGGYAVVSLNPLALSAMITARGAAPGGASLVQLRDGGAILARSARPVVALSQRVSPNDPVLLAAAHSTGGKFRDRASGVDRLVARFMKR